MSNDLTFAALIEQVRIGDQAASRLLLERYGAAVRRVARMRIRQAMLSGQYDSVDVFQSVMRSFLMRVKQDDNNWHLDTPEQLLNLLLNMTDNTVVDKIRAATADKRGGGERLETIDVDPRDNRASRSVEEELATKELAAKCWDRLSTDGQRLFRLYYFEQLEWNDVAAQEGSTAEACRKKLERALKSVAEQFPSEERGDG